MNETNRPLLADLREELHSLAGELREMLRLRFELFRLEAAADLKNTRRLLMIWGVSGVLVLMALPLFTVALADLLAGVWQIARWGWLLIIAGLLLSFALLAAYSAWRRFCRRFVGLRETLEELREDSVWLEEWLRAKRE